MTLRRLHINTIADDDLQPFSLCTFLNSKPETINLDSPRAEVGVGCAKGHLLVFEIKTQKRAIAVVAGVSVPAPQSTRMTNQTPPECLIECRRMSVKEPEPVLYLSECLGPH